MGFPKRHQWPHTLADVYGPFCAECLSYISAKKYQEHHVIPEGLVSPLLNGHISRDWKVPAHATECHQRKLDFLGGSARSALELLLSKASVHQLVKAAELVHRAGDPALSLLMRLHLLKTHRRHELLEEDPQILENILRSTMTLRWTENIAKRIGRGGRSGSILLCLRLAQDTNARGDRRAAEKWLALAEHRISANVSGAQKEGLEGVLFRAKAEVTRSLQHAEDAIHAQGGRSAMSTETLLIGMCAYASGHLRKAKDAFESLEAAGQQVPWHYRAITAFNRGMMAVGEQGFRRAAYTNLIRAQYIACFLGVHMGAHQPPAHGFSVEHGPQMPGHFLCAKEFASFSRDQLTEWRKTALGFDGLDGIFASIRAELAVWPLQRMVAS